MSGASKQANGQASGPVLQSVFLAVLDHSASLQTLSSVLGHPRTGKAGAKTERKGKEKRKDESEAGKCSEETS